MDKPVYLSPDGLEKLKAELRFMKSKERPRISQAIAEAREKGDLSENAEYDAAKEAQGLLEARIAKMETTIANARVVDEAQMDSSKAFILSTVKVKNVKNGMEQAYTLVSAAEADITKGRISVTSPIGKGLLGKEVGDVVAIRVPAGECGTGGGGDQPLLNVVIDLRSDTVTRPTASMRQAMAGAEVGDDVFGEDPTVIHLQERVASILGKQAALFVPSGSMANALAIKIHTQPGDEVICEAACHIANYEAGAPSALSGVQLRTVGGRAGSLTASEVELAIRRGYYWEPRPKLVCLENTHNQAGGTIQKQAEVVAIAHLARERGLALHLDGARLWNASVATGQDESTLAAPFDTVSVCLSKGLGAPAGSLIAGPASLIREAHRWRKILGGGMRQVGGAGRSRPPCVGSPPKRTWCRPSSRAAPCSGACYPRRGFCRSRCGRDQHRHVRCGADECVGCAGCAEDRRCPDGAVRPYRHPRNHPSRP